jgi:glycosyltransferase involved in cell wall biosynthesis
MAYGKPIIGSIDGEVANIIRSSKSGYVSEAENSVLLAENICRLIDEGDFKELGKNAKKFYEENFSKQSFFEKLENEFYSVGGNNV